MMPCEGLCTRMLDVTNLTIRKHVLHIGFLGGYILLEAVCTKYVACHMWPRRPPVR